MIDTWALDGAYERFTNAIPDEAWTDNLEKLADDVQNEIDNLEAWVEPAAPGVDPTSALGHISDLQTRVRMGTYDPKMHGTLEEVLDEIARLLR